MAHNLYLTQSGKAAMAYVGTKPWHELGQELQRGASIDTWDAQAYGYHVVSVPALYMFDGQTRVAPNRQLFARSDNGEIIGQGSDRFKLVQPRQALEFFDGISHEYGYELETAGALKNGAVIWALAKRNADIAIKGTGDTLGTYILFATSFDGSTPTTGRHTCVRVVCQNTMNAAFNNSQAKVSVRHTAEFDAENMRRQLGVAENVPDMWNQFENDINEMHEISVTKQSQVLAFAANVLQIDDVMKAWQDNNRPLHEIVAATTHVKGAEPTVWGLVNGVTAYADHIAGRTADSRLQNSWFGRTGGLKDRAYTLAKQVIQGDKSVIELEAIQDTVAPSVIQSAANDFANLMGRTAKVGANVASIES